MSIAVERSVIEQALAALRAADLVVCDYGGTMQSRGPRNWQDEDGAGRFYNEHFDSINAQVALIKLLLSGTGSYAWTPKERKAAQAEGWDLFINDDGLLTINRIDEREVFPSDAEALAHVVDRYFYGSITAKTALVFHKETV